MEKSWRTRQTKKGVRVAGFDLNKRRERAKKKKCPAFQNGREAELKFDPKETPLSRHRAYERPEEFEKRRAARSGVEATNSCLKRQTGLNRLRNRIVSEGETLSPVN
jgi:hypothetical protein